MGREKKDLVGGALAILVTLALIGAGVGLYIPGVPKENGQLFSTWIVAVIGLANIVYTFFFGSSRGSARKDETIAQLTGPEGPNGGKPPAVPG